MAPFFENKLGVVKACDNLAGLWGLALSPESPFQPTPCSTPVRDHSPTVSSFESTPFFSHTCRTKKLAIIEVQVLFWRTYLGQDMRPLRKQANRRGRYHARTREISSKQANSKCIECSEEEKIFNKCKGTFHKLLLTFYN